MDVDRCFFFLGGGWEHACVFFQTFFLGGTRLKVGVVVFLACFIYIYIYVFFVCV